MVYLLNTYGFCQGVKHSIDILKLARAENQRVFSLLPLMHNEREYRKLISQYSLSEDAEHADAVLFPAHGHTREQAISFTGKKTYDAICPFLMGRHDFVHRRMDVQWYLCGRKDHQECKAFLSEFPSLIQFEGRDDFPPLKKGGKTGLLIQSTLSEEEAQAAKCYSRFS